MADKEIPVAQVYAESLLQIGVEKKTLDVVKEELRAFVELLTAQPRFELFLDAPSVAREDKRAMLRKVLGGKASPVFINFLCVLVDKGRLSLIRRVASIFEDLLDHYSGQIRGTVTAATNVSDPDRQALESILSDRYGKRVLLTPVTDPGLIGGMVLRVGDELIDGSVRTQLKEIRERMLLQHAH